MNKEEIEELEIEIQNILAPYFIILDGRDDTQENIELIKISKNISRKVSENYVLKAEVKEKIEKYIKENKSEGYPFPTIEEETMKDLLKELNI